MPANVINGTDVCLFITSGATKKCIALATTCKINVTMGTRKVACKDSLGAEESVPTRYSWSCDSDNFFTQDVIVSGLTFDNMIDLQLGRTLVTITIGTTTSSYMGFPQTLGVGKSLSGTAWVTKCDLTAKDNDNTTYTINMEGTGPLTHA